MRSAILKIASRIGQPIVINSFGRSGSTLLYYAVASSASRIGEPGSRLLSDTAWNLGTTPLERGKVYKTHDYPPDGGLGSAKLVYVFGDPVEATASLDLKVRKSGKSWLDSHCDHLKVPRCAPGEYFDSDCLRIAAHFTTWVDQRSCNAAFVRYEALWDHAKELSDYVGFHVKLPRRKPRRSSHVAGGHVYAGFKETLDAMPDWSILKIA